MTKQNLRRNFKAFNQEKNMLFYSDNQNGFARDFDLHQSQISNCISGKSKKHKGWKFYPLSDEMNPIIAWRFGDFKTYVHVSNESDIIDQYVEKLKAKLKEH